MLGDYKQALENEYMSLSLSKMSFREDSIEMIQCYSRFGLYHMVMNDKDKALYFLHKSLYLMVLAFTEGYPDILINIANIARIHQQNKDIGQAIKCYVKAVDLLSAVYPSRVHINISFCYSSLASLHYEIDEYRKSVDYQSESAAILAKVMCLTMPVAAVKRLPVKRCSQDTEELPIDNAE